MTENGVKTEMDQEEEDNLLHSDEYKFLVEYGISKKVAAELEKIYTTGKLSHSELDERALDALKEFNPDDAVKVLQQFTESSLEHVTNKSAFLCGQMKTFRQKSKGGGPNAAPKGPDPDKIKEILDRSGYTLDVTTGQRKYGGPPPGWEGNQPGPGHEVFIGKIPKDVFEDEIIPLVEECGKVWDLRLMMDPMTGFSRGYAFCTFVDKKSAKAAVEKLEGYEIKKGKTLKANISIANQRLFVGNIPKSKTQEEIKEEFSKRTEGLIDVIIYRSVEKDNQKNRGFAFLDYDSHKSASTAKRKLMSGRVKVWNCDIIVDWADPVEEPDDETMAKVKVLYVKNLTADVTEETLKETFEKHGAVERVKKIKDYGFVHFEERDGATAAMEALNGTTLGKLAIEVSLAKPAAENKKKQQRQASREMRMMGGMRGPGFDDFYGPPGGMMPRPPPLMRGMGRRMPPPDYFYDDYYGYYDDGFDYYGGYAPPPVRGRGGRGGPMPPPGRGRGGVPPRGGLRGGPAAARGMRGAARGRVAMMRGRGAGGPGRGQQTPPRGAKRKAPEATAGAQAKRRATGADWGAQPIAQQPLGQSGYGAGYSGEGDAQWYQDSYGQNWG
ncbi:heterogeneous nuclear ribonucleoprotein R-like isoform X1 [Mercenaria mercenaria]|uniref:heterogeneous nuclear ribonucleoprotein R-like isoform X1 n=1 Tax=Mercenaria mercenaria TaxID=6596 RepID=UPI001E1D26F8|nr:heterogeneous nuclear ribonucleoprotein R-like isoform X1 [Mercenaria mercenaria]